MKKTIQILAALLLLLALCAGALADSRVEYVSTSEVFTFRPGTVYHATDLFENFKNILPGDTLTQTITVRNGSQSDIRVFLQAAPEASVATAQKDFLNQLRLTVTCGNREIFDAQADQAAQLTEPVLLGFLAEHPRGEVELTVTLEAPIDMGNAYMDQLGVVPWTFLVQEIPNDGSPDTGDWFVSTAWIAAAGLLLLAIAAVVLLMARRRRAEK